MQDAPPTIEQFPDFAAVIDAWPSAREFAREVAGEEHQELGRIWRRRNRVPSKYHAAVQTLLQRRSGVWLSPEYLAGLNVVGRGQGY